MTKFAQWMSLFMMTAHKAMQLLTGSPARFAFTICPLFGVLHACRHINAKEIHMTINAPSANASNETLNIWTPSGRLRAYGLFVAAPRAKASATSSSLTLPWKLDQ